MLIDIKCKNCNKLLGKAVTFIGVIKCSRCKMIFEYKIYTNNLQSNTSYDNIKLESTETTAQ